MKITGILKGTIAILFTLLLTLLAGELICRAVYPLISNYDLEMWRYAAYGKIPKHVLSHINRPNAYFKKLYGTEVRINSKGLREYEYDYNKDKGIYRIVIMGDSMTFGWGVDFDKIYSKVLEKRLNKNAGAVKYEVINMGSGNYNMADNVTLLKEEGLKYNPDMIIIGCFINDAELHSPLKYYFLKKHSYLYAFIWSKINAIENRLNPKRSYYNYYSSLYVPGSKTREGFEEAVSELKTLAGKKQIPVLFLIIPDLHNLKNYPFSAIHQYMADQLRGCGYIKVIDLLDCFDKNIDPMLYWVSREDTHASAKAHELIAEAIYKKMGH